MRSEYEMKKICEKCIKDLKELGITVGDIKDIQFGEAPINTYAITYSKRSKDTGEIYHEIIFSSMLLDERFPLESARGVMYHELLHTVNGCISHESYWTSLAERVESKFPECPITLEHSDIVYMKIPEDVIKEVMYKGKVKYIIRCKKCGEPIFKTKMANFVKHPEQYTCACGGDFGPTEYC